MTLCERCGCEKLPECENGFTINRETETAKRCPNFNTHLKVKAFHARVGPELAAVRMLTKSPLFEVRKGQENLNRASENLFIRGVSWGEFLTHFKLVLAGNPELTFKIVDDRRLKDVFLGGEKYNSLNLTAREERETNNVVADLVSEDYGLVIVKLGYMGYKNRAAPGVLKEALMVRESFDKPTWLFESSDPLKVWQHSKDPEVEAYVQAYFQEVWLGNPQETPVEEESNGIEVEEYVPAATPPPPRLEEPEETPWADLDLPGQDNKPRYKSKGRKGGRQ